MKCESTSHFSGYAKTSGNGASENSRYKYQVALDMAMTVRMIMILLYGAGGEPGRGEIPMMWCSTPQPKLLPAGYRAEQGRRGQILLTTDCNRY
jgi:hypothetical protein